jgi:protoporphyrinogen oxidase
MAASVHGHGEAEHSSVALRVESGMRVGVIGGGLMGLALAQRIAALGNQVTVLERDRQLGGLTTYHDYGSFVWDRFYHVILPTDSSLIGFLDRIGLADRLRWRTTKTGFFVDRTFYPLNDSLDFLRFPPLSLWSKARLAATILYCARIEDWRALERVSVEDFLIKISGRATYEKLWKPLLLAKLGENYRRVSAVFIWSYVKRMFSARASSAKKEQLGHVSGGYKTVFDRLETLIGDAGGSIKREIVVRKVSPAKQGLTVTTDRGELAFDRVIFTSPVNVLRETASELVEVGGGSDVEYLGVICLVLVTREPLMPYYVLNIADDEIPFTGVIGMSNVVSTEETAGRHITYVPRYVLSTAPDLRTPDDEVRAAFMAGMQRLFPGFDGSTIESVHVNRAAKVQPLQVIGYSDLVPRTTTRHPDFFVLNTAQFVHGTLNNNSVIAAVDAFIEAHSAAFRQSDAAARPVVADAACSVH